MCKKFRCESCQLTFFDRCKQVAFGSIRGCDSTRPSPDATRCESCIIIKSVIEELQHLIFKAPFLETHGLSGLDEIAQWERSTYESLLFKTPDSKGWEDEAESRDERQKVAHKISAMGLDGLRDGRDESQEYGRISTPSKATEDTDKENREPLGRFEVNQDGAW